MLDQMRHAAAALRSLAAAAEDLPRRHHSKLIELHQAPDGLPDVTRGDDIALADDHETNLATLRSLRQRRSPATSRPASTEHSRGAADAVRPPTASVSRPASANYSKWYP